MLGGSGILVAHFALAIGGPAQLPASAFENADCVKCHEVQAAEWNDSQHRTAFTEHTFQTAYALEPLGFCSDCHAPEAARVGDDAAALGVACVTCHVRDDAILAAPREHASASPHAIVREAAFASTSACASCHQFEFPDAELRDAKRLMQSTVDEHATSTFADRSCSGCHMPRETDGHRSHAFAASRDPELLRSAVEIEASRTGADTIAIELRADRVGHAFPTGDLLRRLEVSARVDGGEPAYRYLARHFGRQRQHSGIVLRGELRDDRVPADGSPRRVELRVPDSAGKPLHWRVVYQRVAHQRSFDERDALLDGDVEIAAGVLGGEE